MARGRSLYLVGAVAAVYLLITACGGARPGALTPGRTTVAVPVVSTNGNRFSPAVLEVTAGQTARFQIAEVSELHTFTVSPWNVNEAITASNQTVEFMVPDDARGDVPFFCSVHVGMAGTLRVRM